MNGILDGSDRRWHFSAGVLYQCYFDAYLRVGNVELDLTDKIL